MRLVLLLAPALLMGQAAPPKSAPAKPATAPRPAAKKAAPSAKAAAAKPATPAPLTTDDEKIVYAVGLSMYRSLAGLDLSPAEVQLVQRAIADAAAGKPAIELTEWGPKIQSLAQARSSRVAEKEKVVSKELLDKVAAEPGAVRTPSGLVYKELRAGTGPNPKPSDTVKVNYRGTLANGTEFDSSYKRGEPAQFPLTGVIKCWTEGVQKIAVGGKAQLVCPSDLAYGDNGRPGIPGGAALNFEIELLEIVGSK